MARRSACWNCLIVSKTKPDVLLLHGVLMNTVEMLYLERQLNHQGFTVHSMHYASVRRNIAENTRLLYQKINSLNLPELHIVAHSLGGIMAMRLLQQYPELPNGRVVMLGTPLNGSYIAKRLMNWPLVNRLLENSMTDGLDGQSVPPPSLGREVGMIAGNSNAGLGLVIGGLPGKSDGTVLLSETQHPMLKEHITLDVSHTGMIFSQKIAHLVGNFLNTGTFAEPGQ